VFSWGNGEWGRLGQGANSNYLEPKLINPDFFDSKPKKVYAGEKYSGVITEKGEVYMFGKNERFHLGIIKK
jgi:alpha-tubulin suppressor-like RCC1 family protein